MLQALGPGPVEGMVCTPSLLEADYPSSLQDAVEWFRNEDAVEWFRDEPSIIDTEPFVARVLISANNCLIPTSHAFVRYQIAHRPEAIPLHFFLRGYRETYSYEEEMRAFLQSFMGISEARASETISALFQAYEALQVPNANGVVAEGHTLKISVPRAALAHFVYPSVAWGNPVRLYSDRKAAIHAVPVFPQRRLPPGCEPMALDAFLRTLALSELQSGILAHPNLFLRHGARTRVFHANPRFDAEGFRAEARRILEPFIAEAQRRGSRIHYTLFNE